jgi:hypothetical protein
MKIHFADFVFAAVYTLIGGVNLGVFIGTFATHSDDWFSWALGVVLPAVFFTIAALDIYSGVQKIKLDMINVRVRNPYIHR